MLFLALVFAGSRVLGRSRVLGFTWLTVTSLYFYAAWDARYLWLLGASTLLDYVVGGAIAKTEDHGRRKALLACSVAGNLGMLGVFKYGDFVLELTEGALGLVGRPTTLPRLGVALPIGISFYSFQTLSYSIDIYRRTLRPARNLLEFTLFISFFPQLVAGPIVRAAEFLPQLVTTSPATAAGFGRGLVLICVGMLKKVVLGDGIAHALVEPFFANPSRYNGPEALLADWAAYFALYCDFSGYTDIAIGSALLFGYQLPVNFDRPAFAASPAEHWRRWHITLGNFLRDYLYLPLGGSQVSAPRQWLNLFLVFFVSGVWHGVGLSYVVMGLYNGVLAATWRLLRPRPSERVAVRALEGLVAFQLTAFSVACLRPIPLARLGEAARSLGKWGAASGGLFDPWAVALLIGVVALHLSPRAWKERLLAWGEDAPALGIALLVVLTGGMCALYASGSRDFYYFQF